MFPSYQVVTILFFSLLLMTGCQSASSAPEKLPENPNSNRVRLPNGYLVDPSAMKIANTVANAFKGAVELRRTDDGACGYYGLVQNLDFNDRNIVFVIEHADKAGNGDGVVEFVEMVKYYKTACEIRAKLVDQLPEGFERLLEN